MIRQRQLKGNSDFLAAFWATDLSVRVDFNFCFPAKEKALIPHFRCVSNEVQRTSNLTFLNSCSTWFTNSIAGNILR